jgi:hypothetical protein
VARIVDYRYSFAPLSVAGSVKGIGGRFNIGAELAAGAHAILFPSVRHEGACCLALFPQNWAGSHSFVEIMDGAPSEARLTRLDGQSQQVQ